jgi:UDP:flavonoid glycosyltransferase YjiC (YdhE family)
MVTHGSVGDVLPFTRIARELAGRGCAVTLLSHAGFAGSAPPGVEFVAVDSVEAHRRESARSAGLRHARRPGELHAYYRDGDLFARTATEVAELVRRHRPGRTVLVGRHTSAASVLFAAELLGAPACWVALAPTQLMVAPVAVAHHRAGLATGFDAVRERFGLAPVADWAAWFRSPAAVLGLWPGWFDAAGTPAGPGVELTGFVLGDEPAFPGAAEPVDPAVLVTGGTGRLLHPDFYPAALAALAATGRAGIVVTPHRDLLPDQLPPRVRWLPDAPFATLLPEVSAVLHHGGIGTAVRALRSGTPQVILADGADRPDNARRLAARGLALACEPAGPAGWARPEVAAALAAALASTVDKRATLRAAVDDTEGPRRAADAVTGPMRAAPRDDPAGLRRQLRALTPEQRRRLRERLGAAGPRPGSGG